MRIDGNETPDRAAKEAADMAGITSVNVEIDSRTLPWGVLQWNNSSRNYNIHGSMEKVTRKKIVNWEI